MTPNGFVRYVERELAKKDIRFIPANKTFVYVEAARVNGYFDESEATLVCAMNKPVKEWLPVLLHEYSHFCQWKRKSKAWEGTLVNGSYVDDTIFLWLKGKKRFSLKTVKKHAALTRNVEAECEQIAVRHIRKFSLPLDISSYIRQANSYIYFYNYALLRKRWWKRGHAPYFIPEVWESFPASFKKRYSQLPHKYIELYDEYC
jgi:hypothetical protein